jgi:glycosyltransferase involved in cell wall biosynthesis
MKILMLLSNVTGRGTYWRALGFGRELVRDGHEITLLSISPNRKLHFSENEDEGVKIFQTPDLLPGKLRSGWDPFDVLSRIIRLRNHRYDLIHGFESRPVVIGPSLYISKRLSIPLILDWADWFGRGGSVEERTNPIERALLRPVETYFEETFRNRAHGATVICTLLEEKALRLGLQPQQVLLLPNGADIDIIHPQDRAEARRRLGLPQNIPLIAYTGAVFQRDADLMAATFQLILASRPDARLLLIGYTRANLNIEPNYVIKTGTLSRLQLADYLAACDLGWLPLQDSGANRGRFPMKFHDFIAAGRSIVATDVGDVGKAIKEASVGCVVPPEPIMLAQAVLHLLENSIARQQMEKHARFIAETKYAWPNLTAKLVDFYSQILNQAVA